MVALRVLDGEYAVARIEPAALGRLVDLYKAVAESLFATLECELLDRRSWPTRRGLSSAGFDFIEAFYNHRRRHSTLGYFGPADYEASPQTGAV